VKLTTMNAAPCRLVLVLGCLVTCARINPMARAQTIPEHPNALARDPRWLRLDQRVGRFKTLSVGTSRKPPAPAAELTVVQNASYRGGVGLRIAARTAEQAQNTTRVSLYFYPSAKLCGKKLRLAMNLHLVEGRGFFEWRPRQWQLKTGFLGKHTWKQNIGPGTTPVQHVVPIFPRTDYMDAQFWLKASEPFELHVQGITIEPFAEDAVRIRPEADLIPSGTSTLRGSIVVSAELWAGTAQPPATLHVQLLNPEAKPVSAAELRAPSNPVEAHGKSMPAACSFALDLPASLPPADHVLTVVARNAGGADLAQARRKVTVLPAFWRTE